jgi:hypothetical protein
MVRPWLFEITITEFTWRELGNPYLSKTATSADEIRTRHFRNEIYRALKLHQRAQYACGMPQWSVCFILVSFQVLTAASMTITVLWVVTP